MAMPTVLNFELKGLQGGLDGFFGLLDGMDFKTLVILGIILFIGVIAFSYMVK